jgi:hypothetical protein
MTVAFRPIVQPAKALQSAVWFLASLVVITAGWFAATALQLETPGPYSAQNVERAIPVGFPGLSKGQVTSAGAGDEFAYRITYDIELTQSDAAGLLHSAPNWTASAASTLGTIEMLHRDETGQIDHIARFRIASKHDGSTITAEFSPLPMRLAPPKS